MFSILNTLRSFTGTFPDYLNTVCLLHGNQPPAIEHGFTYCELGCGQAISTLMLASMYPKGRFYAVDFNPSHIANAKRIADQTGIKNIHLSDMSFGGCVTIQSGCRRVITSSITVSTVG